MAELQFHYGVMNAAKSLALLMAAYSYEERGQKVLCLNPRIAERDDYREITSRAGLKREATVIHETTDIVKLVENSEVQCVLVDEAQFLSKEQVDQLVQVADELAITVICYGLLKDFTNQLFAGSAALIVAADSIAELPSLCAVPSCQRKGIMNLRVDNGRPVYRGEQLAVQARYWGVCRYHYYRPNAVVLK